MIQLRGIIKNYGFHPVLRGVELHVRQGEFVTLVGPNGAGKSTLLRIVATLLRPTAGDVRVGGWPLITHAEQVRRHIGLVSHQSLLYRDLSAADNLLFFARLYGLADAGQRVQAALRQVGLLARQRDAVGTYSRGMVQRLAIARATLHEPDVLLLDEPYTGLDQEAAALLDELLRREAANGRTILMITHDLGHGLELADRLVILHGGRIVHEVDSRQVSQAALYDLYAAYTGNETMKQ
jgi:heme exporter protein A